MVVRSWCVMWERITAMTFTFKENLETLEELLYGMIDDSKNDPPQLKQIGALVCSADLDIMKKERELESEK